VHANRRRLRKVRSFRFNPIEGSNFSHFYFEYDHWSHNSLRWVCPGCVRPGGRHENHHHTLCDETGATAIECGLIAAIVAVGIIVGLGDLRDGLNTLFNNVKIKLTK
jgi:pilus assembly protein Flp/PilA